MGLFGDEAIRLMRTTWSDANELAEELFAIFTSDKPLRSDVPIQFGQQQEGVPSQVFRLTPGSTGPAISIVRGGQTLTVGMNPDGTVSFGGTAYGDVSFGGTTVTGDTFGGITFTPGSPPPPPPGVPPPPAGSASGGADLGGIEWPGQNPDDKAAATPGPGENPVPLWGVVVSKVGGSVYKVRVWARDPGSAPPIGVLDVRQGLIDAEEEIPAGTPVVVVAFPGRGIDAKLGVKSAYMQVPVFVPPPS